MCKVSEWRGKKMRKNIMMSDEISSWYEQQAKEMGINQSSLMVMALKQYIDQQRALKEMSGLPELIKKLQDLKADTEK